MQGSISTYQAVFYPRQSISELQVPAGAGVKDGNKKTDLLYNEYIVYDVAQVPGSYFTLLFIIIYNQDKVPDFKMLMNYYRCKPSISYR